VHLSRRGRRYRMPARLTRNLGVTQTRVFSRRQQTARPRLAHASDADAGGLRRTQLRGGLYIWMPAGAQAEPDRVGRQRGTEEGRNAPLGPDSTRVYIWWWRTALVRATAPMPSHRGDRPPAPVRAGCSARPMMILSPTGPRAGLRQSQSHDHRPRSVAKRRMWLTGSVVPVGASRVAVISSVGLVTRRRRVLDRPVSSATIWKSPIRWSIPPRDRAPTSGARPGQRRRARLRSAPAKPRWRTSPCGQRRITARKDKPVGRWCSGARMLRRRHRGDQQPDTAVGASGSLRARGRTGRGCLRQDDSPRVRHPRPHRVAWVHRRQASPFLAFSSRRCHHPARPADLSEDIVTYSDLME
jgi:hypothetical protein